jgi:diaminohydroxyphosphoribosylaminopyrimidine deaminase/5-amino-6-(5-phosphoribosylamino)uracil reductase
MTAIGTVKADDPELTSRIRGGRNPKRIVIDPDLEIPLSSRLLQVPPETILVTKERAEIDDSLFVYKINNIVKSGAYIIYFKETLYLDWLMEKLGGMGITSLLIEGGASLNAHALGEGIVDKVMFFIAPKILGGRESYPAVGGAGLNTLEDAYALRDVTIRRLGEDLLVEGYL